MENDFFKNVIYAGVGLASVTVEKIEETIKPLVEKGKISDSEGKKIVEDFFKNTEAKKNEFETKLNNVVESVVSKFDFLKRDEVSDLKARIEKLENELAKTKTKVPVLN
ncbi:MAG: hypothetical protein FVQ77_00520 [Cytophagales bacterium]|nr:hypothetical protein [Cytophagales bacterium]